MSTYLGVVLELNGKEIALEPITDITRIKQDGIEAGLPTGTEVHLGSIAGGLKELIKKVDPSFKLPEASEIPEALRGMYGALTSVELTVNDLYVKIPPTADKGQPQASTGYRLGLYVGWSEPQPLAGDLKLKGFSVKIEKKSELPATTK